MTEDLKEGLQTGTLFCFHLYYNVVYGPSCIKDGHYVEVIFIWYKYYRYDFYMRVYLFFNKLNGRELRLSKCQIFIFVFNEYENWQVLIAFYLFIDIYLLYIFAIRSHHQLCCINIICYSLNFYTHLKKKKRWALHNTLPLSILYIVPYTYSSVLLKF